MTSLPRTIRLYEEDSHAVTFTAVVMACRPVDATQRIARPCYAVVLDRTLFFAEGGGQQADPGWLEEIPVLDVQQTEDGIIHHFLEHPLTPGQRVEGRLNADERFRRMQHHSAEHLASGLIHHLYGCNNVGFHLGDTDVTFDIDGMLSPAQLDKIERAANRAVQECRAIHAYYPDEATLCQLNYRSKSKNLPKTRIVAIEGYDLCACCAPHVTNTGEIGIIKLLHAHRYKGGMRIHLLCGLQAFAELQKRYNAVCSIATTLSVHQDKVVDGVQRLLGELEDSRRTLAHLKMSALEAKVRHVADACSSPPSRLLLFEEGVTMREAFRLVQQMRPLCLRLCGLFIGNDAEGYQYVLCPGREGSLLEQASRRMKESFDAKGGGTPDQIQGYVRATRESLKALLDDPLI